MKHLIVFLGHTQLRIQNPVYRQFVQTPLSQRNASLLFLSRSLEEHELVRQVEELQRREGTGPCELTFHLCATLDNPQLGQQIIQTATLIRRIYDCPAFVYCLLPNLRRAKPLQVSAAWQCLAAISNGVNEYPNIPLITHCFLYHDTTMQSLAILLENISQQSEVFDYISRYGYMGKLITRKVRSGDESYVPDFPPVFSTFNARGVTYSDDDIRFILHSSYLHSLLSLSRTECNRVSMEQCNVHVDDLFTRLPLSPALTSLCEGSFFSLNAENSQSWPSAAEYWHSACQEAKKALDDQPRDMWLSHMRGDLNVLYLSRYRNKGVSHYYQIQKSRTSDYCRTLLTIIRQELQQIMMGNPYPPETAQDILRSVINRLQQLTLLFEQQHQELEAKQKSIERHLDELSDLWDNVGIFDRMRGKDKHIFEAFIQDIPEFFISRTHCHGASFAIKLLNELIPQVSTLGNTWSATEQVCQQAYTLMNEYVADNTASDLLDPAFPTEPLLEAIRIMQSDTATLHHDYLQMMQMLRAADRPIDGEDLVKRLRSELSEKIDHYIADGIASGRMDAVIGVSIIARLESLFADRGGIKAYIDQLKKETTLTLQLKNEGRRSSQYLLIAPDCEGIGPHVTSSDGTRLQMLHIKSGLGLPDLDGFSGQRMFVEPSIF